MELDLLGTNDIAELLGVSRQRSYQLISYRNYEFPDPVAIVNARTKIWTRDQILDWARLHQYDIIPAPSR